MPSLHARLQDLASSFADDVLAAIRTASLDELVGGSARPTPPRGSRGGAGQPDPLRKPKGAANGRLARRSTDDIQAVLGRVVAALKTGPMRAEEIKSLLKLDKRELPRVLAAGFKSKVLKKKGQKRGRTYSAG